MRFKCTIRTALSFIFLITLMGVTAFSGSCDNGCITLCNKTGKKISIVTANPDGGMSCAFSGKGCRVKVSGWWVLKPGKCFEPSADLYWETYYSVVKITQKGEWKYPSWPVNKRLLNGNKSSGLSGYSGYSICVDKKNGFNRTVSGKMMSAFKEKCPAGYVKSPVNLYTKGKVDYNMTLSIK